MSGLRLVLSPKATSDLRDILQFTEVRWSPEQRDSNEHELTSALSNLLTFPAIGRLRLEYGTDTRAIIVGQHTIMYRATPGEIRILRIIHARRAGPSNVGSGRSQPRE